MSRGVWMVISLLPKPVRPGWISFRDTERRLAPNLRSLVFRVFAVSFFAVWAGPSAVAQLRWEATTVDHEMKLGEETALVGFAFSNSESRSITVLHMSSSCGCTIPTLEKKTYAPGEKGRIEVVFDARNLSGLQVKTIQVFTAEAVKPVTLTLRVTIPIWLEIAPRLVAWAIGEEARPKEVVLTLQPGVKIREGSVRADNPIIAVALKRDGTDRRYRLILQPRSTEAPVQVTVSFEAVVTDTENAPRRFLVVTQVR